MGKEVLNYDTGLAEASRRMSGRIGESELGQANHSSGGASNGMSAWERLLGYERSWYRSKARLHLT